MSTATTSAALDAWLLASTPPDEVGRPSELDARHREWLPAPVPGTAAQALQAAGRWSFDHPRDFDASDWWYRCTFRFPPSDPAMGVYLRFGGLATLARVWLNGEPILESDNMFQSSVVDVTPLLCEVNDVLICCRALIPALATRRARPRWKTRLVDQQQLRWIRTTLLGRMRGWCPPVAPVGPWRPISLEIGRPGSLTDVYLRTHLAGETGIVEMSAFAPHPGGVDVSGTLSVGGASIELRRYPVRGGSRISAELRIPGPERWWPHTHGVPHLYPAAIGLVVDGEATVHDAGAVGFREVRAHRADAAFAPFVNGVPVFCRGACWTVDDIVSPGASNGVRQTLQLLRDAGGNMVRVTGTMVYESDDFYRVCDELGILVWQDFMFARMDYPEDPAFLTSVRAEATQQVRRLCRHPSVAVYCGNTEVEQQAAMVGVARDLWRSPLFAEVLPEICARWHPGVPYVPSSPTGGGMPFHPDAGVSHFYGVGAYLRPVEDARRSGVRFATECLAFANVPGPEGVRETMRGHSPATHDPRWKERVPRDAASGWDFEDVRDHYLAALFGVDPGRLRSTDTARYLDLSRVATAEVMSRVFAEWRSPESRCHGALVWFLKDLWPGAGWGILDSRGRPKACFYYLRRAWQPQAVLLTDEGLNGVHVHVVNDTDRPLSATLEVVVLREGAVTIAQGKAACTLGPRARATYASDAVLDGFHDVSYAYRFGPLSHDVVAAGLRGDDGEAISEAFWCPSERDIVDRRHRGPVSAVLRHVDASTSEVVVSAERFLYGAHIEVAGYVASDDYFHVMPGRTRAVQFRPLGPSAPARFSGRLEALNLEGTVRIGGDGRPSTDEAGAPVAQGSAELP